MAFSASTPPDGWQEERRWFAFAPPCHHTWSGKASSAEGAHRPTCRGCAVRPRLHHPSHSHQANWTRGRLPVSPRGMQQLILVHEIDQHGDFSVSFSEKRGDLAACLGSRPLKYYRAGHRSPRVASSAWKMEAETLQPRSRLTPWYDGAAASRRVDIKARPPPRASARTTQSLGHALLLQ